jgi:FkbM family methyltransferase
MTTHTSCAVPRKGFAANLTGWMASYAYSRFLSGGGRKGRRWGAVREALIRWLNDPPCKMEAHGQTIWMPLSHALPTYLKQFPQYDRLPSRLAAFLRQRHGSLFCVDVGANIGDTIAAVYGPSPDRFLAVEPNPRYAAYLKANWGVRSNVRIEDCLLSERSDVGRFVLHEQVGTARFELCDSGKGMRMQTLDEVVTSDGDEGEPNLIKIDTDGHDFSIIRGAQRTIARCRPAVLFECGVMPPADYIRQAMEAIASFGAAGYGGILIYDNFGRLMGRYPANDSTVVRQLLLYQMTCRGYYFDILALPGEELEAFYRLELERVFAGLSPDLRAATSDALATG